jgi:hypothetical protein
MRDCDSQKQLHALEAQIILQPSKFANTFYQLASIRSR